MNTENSKKNWGIVNVALGDLCSPCLTLIISQEGDSMVVYETEEGVEILSMEEYVKRYNLTKKATIMRSSLASREDVLKADFEHLVSIIEKKQTCQRTLVM